MKRYSTIALLLATVVAVGCKDNPVANPIDAPTVDALGELNRTSLLQLAIGVLAQDRTSTNTTASSIISAIYSRDVYRVDASEPRYVSETLGGQPDPGSFAGSGAFAGFYTAIRAANTLLLSLESAPASQFTSEEVSATKGFIRTMKAIDYYKIMEMHDTVGAPIQSEDPAEVTDVRCKTAVLAYVAALLDSANADFSAAGSGTELPFTLPTGFTAFGRDYSTVDNLIRFNRGWKGKVDFYRGMDHQNPQPALFPAAITELTEALGGAAPGAVPPSDFMTGAWYVLVPGGSENEANVISDAKIGLNPQVKDSIQAGDTRASKIVSRPLMSANYNGGTISTTITYIGAVASSANQAAPLAILRDEELVLLRAQAYIEAGQLLNARADINDVRTNYGLAAHLPFTSKDAAITALLYEKRYSLLFEGPQRLADLRAYSRLSSTYFKPELPGDPYNAALPLPRAELNARGLTTNPACTP